MQWYVKLYRKILNQPLSSNCSLLGFFCYLLMKASHKARVFYLWDEKVALEKGQLIVSQRKLAQQFNVSTSTIHRRLKILTKERFIEMQWCAKYSLLTVLFEASQCSMETLTEHEKNKEETLIETYKNDNNEKKEENEHSSLISCLKKKASQLWIAYNQSDEAESCQKLLTDQAFLDLSIREQSSPEALASSIMEWSFKNKFWKWPCAWPKAILQNYVEVYNQCKVADHGDWCEINQYIGTLSKSLQARLFVIKKEREERFPYKKPFVNMAHVDTFVQAINDWKL